jgi:Flp pilus assembly protein TadB
MTLSANALYQLASEVESASSIRSALIEWSKQVSHPVVRKIGRVAGLGAPLEECLRPLTLDPNGDMFARAITMHAAAGGSLAHTLRTLTAALEEREALAHEARAAASASALSTRLLGGLAITCVLLMPAWQRAPARVLVATSSAALILATLGTLWMRKLRPGGLSEDHPIATTSDLVAALLDAGLTLSRALELACPAQLRTPRRLVRLGMSWPDALERSDQDGSAGLAAVLRRAQSTGAPVAAALRQLATALRQERRRACEVAARRAPVMLVLPLALCYLPAFGLVMIGPLLGGMAG